MRPFWRSPLNSGSYRAENKSSITVNFTSSCRFFFVSKQKKAGRRYRWLQYISYQESRESLSIGTFLKKGERLLKWRTKNVWLKFVYNKLFVDCVCQMLGKLYIFHRKLLLLKWITFYLSNFAYKCFDDFRVDYC